MEIRVGTFLKEINSTKAPNISSTTTPGFTNIEVQLKDNVSLHAPIILLPDAIYDPEWNYVYIEKWKRFCRTPHGAMTVIFIIIHRKLILV